MLSTGIKLLRDHAPAWTASACLAAILVTPLRGDTPDAVVTFHELHYNPPGSQDGEWRELHNQMAVDGDMSGWSLADGISYTFPTAGRIDSPRTDRRGFPMELRRFGCAPSGGLAAAGVR